MKLLFENWRLFSTIGLTLACVGAMISIGATPQGDLTSGEGIYMTHCANCHGANGSGRGTAADFVHDKKRMSKSDEELLESIRNGLIGNLGYMPPWKDRLSEEQIKAVLKYIRNTF